jgi:hypothetical protein
MALTSATTIPGITPSLVKAWLEALTTILPRSGAYKRKGLSFSSGCNRTILSVAK